MLELYHAKISTCSQKVRLVLAEKNLAWKSSIVNLAAGQQLSPEYLKINPNGVVPTLIDDGHIVRDSTVINEYIEDVHSSKPLRPTDPKLVTRMREWQQYIDEVPTPAVRPLSFNTYFLPIWSGMSDEEFFDYTERLPLRKHFYRKMGKSGFSKEEISEATERLARTLHRVEDALQNGEWLVGNHYTLADASLTPTIVRLEDLGLVHMWRDLPRVIDWFARIKARPSFDIAYMAGARDLKPAHKATDRSFAE
jgi:glutathione S-transferase